DRADEPRGAGRDRGDHGHRVPGRGRVMSRLRPPRALAIAAAVSATVAAPVVSASQRYASAAASIVPVPMASSCAAPAAHEVDTGAAWLLVRAPDAARAAFDRAA